MARLSKWLAERKTWRRAKDRFCNPNNRAVGSYTPAVSALYPAIRTET
jgi:hypothetical protein